MCALDEQRLRGQEWHAVGSTGGQVLDHNDAMGQGGVVPTGSLIVPLGSVPRVSSNPDVRVLMLIIDDFGSAPTGRSHGDRVLEIATAAYHSIYNQGNIVIDTVDYSPENTETVIASRIATTINAHVSSGDYDYIVLNMSFVFLPCQVELQDEVLGDAPLTFEVAAFLELARNMDAEQVDQSLVGYILSLVPSNVEPRPTLDQVESILAAYMAGYATSSGNQLEIVIDDLENQVDPLRENVVSLASAGNFGDLTSGIFAPGSWDNVISVGGHTADVYDRNPISVSSTDKWVFANDGEIMAPAAWFATRSGDFISGTSFAAPFASVLTSYMLTSGTCDFATLKDKTFDNVYFVDALTGPC